MNDDATPGRPRKYSGELDFGRIATEFEALRALSESARAAALERLAAETPTLATELRRLFAQHNDDPEELGSPAQAFGEAEVAGAMQHAEDEAAGPPPEQIGNYRVTRELGRGGMGVVYLCERQDSDFKNRVAIKLLRAPLDDSEMQRRFRTERRILAGLQHPNIAALFDGGTTDTGQPYVVMEYVDGPDLLTFCREAGLSLHDRLRLFIKVCRGVAHAHRALVVHRDLKPSNILVSTDGEPKLLDFGIAKLLLPEEHGEASLALTRTGNMLLTPEYSSPEQVRGEPITTATDVYALGALLYELLSGERAQPLENRSLTQLIEVVCERTPPPPSAIANTRGPSAPHSTRLLRGDLDTIVACAMRKEPERRYESAAALAADLGNYLDGLPVTAQGDTIGYRARKFVARHRIALGAAVVVLGLVVAFAITTFLQNQRIAQERDNAITQRLLADEMTGFLVDLFDMASPDPERAETLRARQLLDRGARRIDRDLTVAPAQRAQLQMTMARAYIGLGLYDASRPLMAEAERALREHAGDGSAHRRAQYWAGVQAFHDGDDAAGERLIRASIEPPVQGDPAPVLERVLRLTTLASWLREPGRYDEAEQFLDRAAQLAAENDVTDRTFGVAVTRAQVLRERGRPEQAAELLEATRREAVGDAPEAAVDDPRFLLLHTERGRAYKELEDLESARTAFERTLELTREFTGPDHPDVDTMLFELAMLEIDYGNDDRAIELLREILAHDRARFDDDHPYPALTMGQLAACLGRLDELDEAETLFRDALAIQRAALPAEHPEIATTLSNFANLLRRTGRIDEAVAMYRESLAIRSAVYDTLHPVVLTARNSVAVGELDRGNHAAAEDEFRAVLDARRATLGEHSQTAGSLLSLATAISRQRRYDEAIPLFEESIAMFGRTLPADHPTQARPRIGLGITFVRLQRPDDAIPHLQGGATLNRTALGPENFQTYHAEFWLARALALTPDGENKKAAIELLESLIERMGRTHPGHGMLNAAHQMLAGLTGGDD